jgi:RNA-directed DNA polymerase
LTTAEDKAPGVDGVRRDDIEKAPGGVEAFIAAIALGLKAKSYRPSVVRRTHIPKPNGDLRPLGIPTLRDRVVQRAAVLILEPIFEADFEDCSYGFRPGRSAHDALRDIRESIARGLTEVYDADLKSYFDTIPHDKLMERVERRVSDRSVLNLIRAWLNTPVVEQDRDDAGKPKGPPRVSRPTAGTPQGGVISPLLANIHLHDLDRLFHAGQGPARIAKARLVRYADDFVILARFVGFVGGRIDRWVRRVVEDHLGLTLNRVKTRTVDLKREGAGLDFLGYTFRFDRDRNGRARRYLNVFPSKKSVKRIRDRVRELTGPGACFKPATILIDQINFTLRCWAGYFGGGYPAMAFREVEHYTRTRISKHLNRRSQRGYRWSKGTTHYAHLRALGVRDIPRPRSDPLALKGNQ